VIKGFSDSECKFWLRNDPFFDRRTGDDRHEACDLDYFRNSGAKKGEQAERRQPLERREGCIRVSEWSSICPEKNLLIRCDSMDLRNALRL